jgi:hypothetical protein
MSTIHDDQTQVLTPPPGKPRKKWHQRWSVRIPLGLAALGLIAGVNKLGTGGSGTEYVYGDPGTHHLTVNSEGAWTIKVVTAP